MDGVGGPGSNEPGPSASQDRLETLRRRLYAPGGSAELVHEYLGAEAALGADDPQPPVPSDESESVRGEREVLTAESRRRSPLRRRAALACTAAVVLVLVAVGVFGSSAPLPERIDPPAGPGVTLLFHSRMNNPLSAPDRTTFEPADERMLFRAEGRRLAVVLRCVGRGTVRVTAAEQRFDFRCDDRTRTVTKYSATAVHGPFLILGRTIGNVVWGMRLTSVPSSG